MNVEFKQLISKLVSAEIKRAPELDDTRRVKDNTHRHPAS